MTDIMKLADDYADKVARGKSGTQESRVALQSAIDALQAECAEHKENAIRNARIAVSIRAERDALQAKLDAMGKGEPVPEWYLPRITEVRTRLASLSSAMRPDDSLGMVLGNLSGQLASCERVALRYAAPKALAPLKDEPWMVKAINEAYGIGGAP